MEESVARTNREFQRKQTLRSMGSNEREDKQKVPPRGNRNHERMRGRQGSTENTESLGLLQVWPNLKGRGKLEDKGPAYKITGGNESG